MLKSDFVVCDIDCDQRDEFLFLSPGGDVRNFIDLWDENVHAVSWVLNSSNKLGKPFCANLDKEGDLEIVVPEKIGDSIFMNVYTSEKRQLQRFLACKGVDRNNSGGWDGWVSPKIAVDLNCDRNLEIIAAVRSAHDLYPRGILAFNWVEGIEVWRFETGTQLDNISSADLDGDGLPEIICSTSAPCNGSIANGTDDCHSYVIILDKDGHLLWKKETGGKFSKNSVSLADIDLDGEVEMVLKCNSDPKNESAVTILDAKNRTMRREKPFYSVIRALDIKDITNDGYLDFILLCQNGQLLVLDSQLETLMEFNDPQKSNCMLVEDLNNNGKVEVVLSAYNKETVVLDSELKKVLAIFNDGGIPYSVRTNPGQQKRLALMSSDYLYFLDLKKKLVPPLPWGYIFVGFFGGLFLSIVGFFVVKKLRPASLVTRLKKDLLDDITIGIISIDKTGKLSFFNEQAKSVLKLKGRSLVGQTYQTAFENDELRELRELVDESYKGGRSKKEEIRVRIGAGGREVLTEILPLLDKSNKDLGRLLIVEDITEWSQSKRAMAWISMARLLAHEIKNPLANIMITLQCLQREYQKDGANRSEAYDELVTSSIDEIMRLRNVANGFMRFAKLEKPNPQSTDINRIINETLDEYSKRITGTIHVKAVLAENLPPAKVDEEQIRAMIANLIENSVNAMPEGGALTISTALIQKFPDEQSKVSTDFISIEIADTGIGISKKDLKKVFDPYFSKSKEGVGLGLVIVNRIVEDHNGSININSREGIGTTVTVELPVNG